MSEHATYDRHVKNHAVLKSLLPFQSLEIIRPVVC